MSIKKRECAGIGERRVKILVFGKWLDSSPARDQQSKRGLGD